MGKRKTPSIAKPADTVPKVDQLLDDLRQMIEAARLRVAAAANSGMTLLYWRIGRRIQSDILSGERAAYGKAIVATVSQQLVAEYGRGFTYPALTRMMGFFGAFPDEAIIATLSQQLSWSHFVELLPLKRPLQREYYAAMCRIERWSVRTLRERIDSMLYERTALSREPDELPPLGIILCTGKKAEQIELLEMDRSGIHVAEYLTALPSRKVLAEKLNLAAERARRQLEHRVMRGDHGSLTDKDRSSTQRPTRRKANPKKGRLTS